MFSHMLKRAAYYWNLSDMLNKSREGEDKMEVVLGLRRSLFMIRFSGVDMIRL